MSSAHWRYSLDVSVVVSPDGTARVHHDGKQLIDIGTLCVCVKMTVSLTLVLAVFANLLQQRYDWGDFLLWLWIALFLGLFLFILVIGEFLVPVLLPLQQWLGLLNLNSWALYVVARLVS